MAAEHRLEVLDDSEAVATRGAQLIAEASQEVAEQGERFEFAASGGRTPWLMYGRLEDETMDWQWAEIFQVDERIAPAGSEQRNLTHLILSLSMEAQMALRPMPVTEPELDGAAERSAPMATRPRWSRTIRCSRSMTAGLPSPPASIRARAG